MFTLKKKTLQHGGFLRFKAIRMMGTVVLSGKTFKPHFSSVTG